MNSLLKAEQPYLDQQRKSTISPEIRNNIQSTLHRRINHSQVDLITPITVKQNHKKQAITQGLQQLLKSSPYSKLVQQKSQQQLQILDSFSQQYLNGYAPTPNQLSSQILFKPDIRTPSLNSTTSSSIKPRIRNNTKELLQKKSFDSITATSNREKERQTISQLQNIIQRSSIILKSYKDELQRHINEKQDLIKQIQLLEQIKIKQ
ncbi:unnamed protein product (macronuclear) [Paramecium tetraurelia]|uniref:Uncharacterized protein n=1 Tax=Paramecium tetraurelia TaxID=5888 RepID=A0DR08_PARTE|nr:uncharacterized protein GSPATT00002876001 [Paramecium tetraurelia]CAK85475.1 unnamed protein product [Paramecium tetraurelia]|eukprot:XP_001452872.1 hypothetical protein (macronuclear) [Paramecium tetraurelia strain d4-2]